MSRHLLSVVVLVASLLHCTLGAAAELENRSLPSCTKVEVFYLDPMLQAESPAELIAAGKINDAKEAYYIRKEESWCRLRDTKVLSMAGAEKIAALWRGLAPEPPPASPKPTPADPHHRDQAVMTGHGMAKCHVPLFAYRFYAGDRLLAESTVCWHCENFAVQQEGKSAYHSFDVKAPAAVELQKSSLELFAPH